ncbi:MAG: BatA and WFA domain-containing protein [bacterium]|nr:BatA and WFA domain-containing protein [bacterium]
MNFLNPFVLFGMLAAGIPLVLHLLNLRKLRTVEFSTLRFLEELQQTRVRNLKLQQILLLILRTLIIVFAVLAFARPTIPGNLPLLGAQQRASVVILVDNSASMEAADQQGPRLRQALATARQIVSSLKDGDEVAVLPLSGFDAQRTVTFTSTFTVAREMIDRIAVADDRSDLPRMLRVVDKLFKEARHVHHEVFVISDMQTSLTRRDASDSGVVLADGATMFVVRIGDGLTALEQNLSVDSLNVITKLFQPDKPVEIEAIIRNGSKTDAVGIPVSMAFDGVRVAQRAVDVPAGTTRSVVVAAPPQRRGIIAAHVEVENDAIDRDNIRYAGIIVPPRARVLLVGAQSDIMFLRTALSLPGMEQASPEVSIANTAAEAASRLGSTDVVMISGSAMSTADAAVFKQWVERGGGLVLFANESPSILQALPSFGFTPGAIRSAPANEPWTVTSIDRSHPLFVGVFKGADEKRMVESPRIERQLPVTGGVTIMSTSAGPLISESTIGGGRVLFVAIPPTLTWSTFPVTGLFAATAVRMSMYLLMPRDAGLEAGVGEPVSAPVPPRHVGVESFLMRDVSGITTNVRSVRMPSATLLTVPAQPAAGVVKISTTDSASVMTVAVNVPNDESILDFLSPNALESSVKSIVSSPDNVVIVSDASNVSAAISSARTGSELWPLFVVLAILCAFAEMLVSAFFAREPAAVPA